MLISTSLPDLIGLLCVPRRHKKSQRRACINSSMLSTTVASPYPRATTGKRGPAHQLQVRRMRSLHFSAFLVFAEFHPCHFVFRVSRFAFLVSHFSFCVPFFIPVDPAVAPADPRPSFRAGCGVRLRLASKPGLFPPSKVCKRSL